MAGHLNGLGQLWARGHDASSALKFTYSTSQMRNPEQRGRDSVVIPSWREYLKSRKNKLGRERKKKHVLACPTVGAGHHSLRDYAATQQRAALCPHPVALGANQVLGSHGMLA